LDGGTNNQPTKITIVSPDVPDQTSYSGRHYIDLGLDREQFVPPQCFDRNGRLLTIANLTATQYFGGGPQNAPQSAALITSNARLVSRGIQSSGGAPMTLALDPIPDGQAPTATLSITVNATVSNIPTGMTPAAIAALQAPANFSVSLDGRNAACSNFSATYTPGSVGDNIRGYVSISCNISVATAAAPGATHAIQATQTALAQGYQNSEVVTMKATQSGAGGGGSTPMPQLTVSVPQPGQVIGAVPIDPQSNGPFAAMFTGTAAPGQGGPAVSGIQIVINNNVGTAVSAQPDQQAGWANWTADVVIPSYGAFQAVVTLSTADPTISVSVTIPGILEPQRARVWLGSRLMLAEDVRLTNFVGRLGPGRVLRTMSLLPGESSTISVKTFISESYEAKNTSSIFDHVDATTSSDFDDSVSNEQSQKQEHKDSLDWNVQAQASASWGWGNASVNGGVSSKTDGAHEELARNLRNATQKHSESRSSKRDVQVNAESTTTSTQTNEQAIERTIKNINVSRTLNFTFSQLNQEYLSILHLVGVRIGYAAYFVYLDDGVIKSEYREWPLYMMSTDPTSPLPSLVYDPSTVMTQIVDWLSNVADYGDNVGAIIEQMPTANGTYRFKHGLTQTWSDPPGTVPALTPPVPGVILNGMRVIMRTEGVLAEAILGQNNALDAYSIGLQTQAVRQKTIANDAAQQVIDLVNTPVPAKTDAWQKTHPCCQPSTLSIAAVPPANPGASGGAGNPPGVGGAGGGA
jgi:hypothetical protein